MYFCKLPKTTLLRQGRKVWRWSGWGVGCRPSRCRCSVAWNTCITPNVTNKRTNWPLHNLDTVDTWTPISALSVCIFLIHFFLYSGDMGRQDWCEGVFTPGSSGQLSLIWDLQVTLCPHGCLLTGARFMEWDSEVFSLWLAGLQAAMHKVL